MTGFLDAAGAMNPMEQAWDASGRALNERDSILQSLQESAQDVTEACGQHATTS